MPNAAYAIVGRVRKAHGIHGEVVVELFTDTPEAFFAPAGRVFPGDEPGTPLPDVQPLIVHHSRPFKGGLLVGFAGIEDRTEADTLRGLYLLAPFGELEPLAEGEVYLHDLIGLTVRLTDGTTVGEVSEAYELPQGVVLEVQRSGRESAMVPYRVEVVRAVDIAGKMLTIDPPAGLLD